MSENRDMIDDVLGSSGHGGLKDSATTLISGIDHRALGSAATPNRDDQGLILWTKPKMNLSYDNVEGIRKLNTLKYENSRTLAGVIVASLDPDGAKGSPGYVDDTSINPTNVKRGATDIVDPDSAFISLFTNTVLSLSGWPDYSLDLYTSKEGNAKETFTYADSFPKDYSNYSLTANFQNLEGDPISAIFNVWLEYMSRVGEGSMVPYPDMIIENEVDYQTRIYRLVLDKTRRYVQRICCCGVAIPVSSPTGAAFNFTKEQSQNTELNQVTIPFNATGFMFDDPILIVEFNRTVAYFNPDMRDRVDNAGNFVYEDSTHTDMTPNSVILRWGDYVRIPEDALGYCNNRGYPRIGPGMELEWWLPREEYNSIITKINSMWGV